MNRLFFIYLFYFLLYSLSNSIVIYNSIETDKNEIYMIQL